jgi:hypothetical protein
LLERRNSERDGDVLRTADQYLDLGGGGCEGAGGNAKVPGAGRQCIDAEIAMSVSNSVPRLRRGVLVEINDGAGDAGMGCVFDSAAQAAGGVLSQGGNGKTQQCRETQEAIVQTVTRDQEAAAPKRRDHSSWIAVFETGAKSSVPTEAESTAIAGCDAIEIGKQRLLLLLMK